MNIKTLKKINTAKYSCAPTWKQIESFMKEMGMRMYRFERFFGIPFNCLTKVKKGDQALPAKFWHIIYEKRKPKFGAGFIGDLTEEIINGKPKKKKIAVRKKENYTSKTDLKKEYKHARLEKLK